MATGRGVDLSILDFSGSLRSSASTQRPLPLTWSLDSTQRALQLVLNRRRDATPGSLDKRATIDHPDQHDLLSTVAATIVAITGFPGKSPRWRPTATTSMSARRNGNRARCQHEGCEKFAQTRGLCKAHGGGSRCRDPSCNKLAQSRGLCIAHGGGRRCQHEGCSKLAQSKGFCISHGGGRRCTVPNCEKFSQVKGRCKSHSKLAEHSDHDDGEETGSDHTVASPPHPRVRHARTSTPPHQGDAVPAHHVGYRASPLPRLHAHHGHDALPLPPARSFGLVPPLAPSHTTDPASSQHSRVHHWDDSHKHTHPQASQDLPPLPYAPTLPSSRPLYERLEDKQQYEQQRHHHHHGYPLLPSRFLPSIGTTLPAVSSIMSASVTTVTSHAMSGPDHFIGHRHAEPVGTVEPTSIPLLSFLDRTNAPEAASQWSTSPEPETSTNVKKEGESPPLPSIAVATASRGGGSPPLPSIVLPPLKHTQQHPR